MSLRYRNVLHSLKKYLPETQAIIDRAISEGFTLPEEALLTHLNKLIKDLIACGYWEAMDLINLFSYNAGSTFEEFSKINFKTPSATLGEEIGTSTIWNNLGCKGAGNNSHYYRTNHLLTTTSSNYQNNNASRTIVTSEGGSAYMDGQVNSFSDYSGASNTTAQRINIGSGSLDTAVDFSGVGFKYMGRFAGVPINPNVLCVKNATVYNRFSNVAANSNNTLPMCLHRGSNGNGNTNCAFYAIGGFVDNTIVEAARQALKNYFNNIGLTTLSSNI